MSDIVMKPKQKSNSPGVAKQVSRGVFSGPTASTATLTPFNRKGKKK